MMVHSSMLMMWGFMIFNSERQFTEKKRDGPRKLVNSVLQSLLSLSLVPLERAGLWKATERPYKDPQGRKRY